MSDMRASFSGRLNGGELHASSCLDTDRSCRLTAWAASSLRYSGLPGQFASARKVRDSQQAAHAQREVALLQDDATKPHSNK